MSYENSTTNDLRNSVGSALSDASLGVRQLADLVHELLRRLDTDENAERIRELEAQVEEFDRMGYGPIVKVADVRYAVNEMLTDWKGDSSQVYIRRRQAGDVVLRFATQRQKRIEELEAENAKLRQALTEYGVADILGDAGEGAET